MAISKHSKTYNSVLEMVRDLTDKEYADKFEKFISRREILKHLYVNAYKNKKVQKKLDKIKRDKNISISDLKKICKNLNLKFSIVIHNQENCKIFPCLT